MTWWKTSNAVAGTSKPYQQWCDDVTEFWCHDVMMSQNSDVTMWWCHWVLLWHVSQLDVWSCLHKQLRRLWERGVVMSAKDDFCMTSAVGVVISVKDAVMSTISVLMSLISVFWKWKKPLVPYIYVNTYSEVLNARISWVWQTYATSTECFSEFG